MKTLFRRCSYQSWNTRRYFNIDLTLSHATTSHQPKDSWNNIEMFAGLGSSSILLHHLQFWIDFLVEHSTEIFYSNHDPFSLKIIYAPISSLITYTYTPCRVWRGSNTDFLTKPLQSVTKYFAKSKVIRKIWQNQKTLISAFA